MTASGITALSGSNVAIARINAEVPNSAPYSDSEVLRLIATKVNGNLIASKGDYAIHKNLYLGDADADGFYTGFDSSLISRVVVTLDSGFDAAQWTDPRIVGDATGLFSSGFNTLLTGLDASYVAQKSVALPRPEIPNLPGIVLVAGTAGVDPELSIGTAIPAAQGSDVTIPVSIDVGGAENVLSSTFDVHFNTAVLSFGSATQGAFWPAGDGWSIFANEVSPGDVRVTMFNAAASPTGSGTIANLLFHVLVTAPLGLSGLDVAKDVGPNEGGLTWTDVDGSVQVGPNPIVGRHLFYNQSGTSTRYDHNDLAINSFDDAAIATDKTAYLWEDAGAATFANVSSYTKGINGIMVDILGSHPSITADDFIFRVGNNNSPGLWSTANAPTSISVRAGAGVGGSDRVTIIWNGAAAPFKEWLEVIVLANADTGLAQKTGHPAGHGDAFFFGNAVGNVGTGDTVANSLVTAADENAIRANNALISANIPITNIYDVGRNASVSAVDESAARLNGTNPTTTLKYLNLTSAPAAPEADSGGGVNPLVASESGDSGVASALAAPAVTSLGGGVPRWLTNRIEEINLNSGSPAKLFQNLHDTNSPRSRALLQKFDAVADALGLDDELLDLLVGDLGL